MKYKGFIIVESPAKAKTLEKYAGKNYLIRASMGHIIDLPKNRIGIDVKNNFKPNYVTIPNKGKIIKELKDGLSKSETVYLATDPDREGEAIAWHLARILDIPEEKAVRIELHEITPDALKKALEEPRPLAIDRVNAQQARRMLDRLVGYNLSPVLWKKVAPGLSAGRVQSVAVRLIVERQKEIDAFKSEEYWTISAMLEAKNIIFKSVLTNIKNKKASIPNAEEAEKIKNFLTVNPFVLAKNPEKKINKKDSPPPYITSTLQQDASRRLGFKVVKTMKIAQQLFEGLDIGEEGPAGLITYMRTDSVRIADSAREDAVKYIGSVYGSEYIGKPKTYKKKAGTQDAHEAIRPTGLFRDTATLKKALTLDQYRLYSLIRDRFIASQMSPSETETISLTIKCGDYSFHSEGSNVIFQGFSKIYTELKEEKEDKEKESEKPSALPEIYAGDLVDLKEVLPLQHFTQPPPHYSEATLVKALEKYGIGRPSTYAPIVETIQKRDYVKLLNQKFVPTKLGNVVTELLVKNFKDIVDINFTAQMENELDEIEEGKAEHSEILKEFYEPFITNLRSVEKGIAKVESLSISEETGELCEKCGKPMIVKRGPYGKFFACSDYPTCKTTKPYLEKIGIPCPKCTGGNIIQKKSKKAIFYGCDRYPECDFTSWHRPIDKKCPSCGGIMVVKYTKSGKGYTQCINSCTRKKEEESSKDGNISKE